MLSSPLTTDWKGAQAKVAQNGLFPFSDWFQLIIHHQGHKLKFRLRKLIFCFGCVQTNQAALKADSQSYSGTYTGNEVSEPKFESTSLFINGIIGISGLFQGLHWPSITLMGAFWPILTMHSRIYTHTLANTNVTSLLCRSAPLPPLGQSAKVWYHCFYVPWLTNVITANKD